VIRVTFFSLILSALLSPGAVAAVYEFELPDLAGMAAGTTLTTTFVYRGPDGNVNALSARVTGVADYLGRIECSGTPPDTSDWVLDIGTSLRKRGDSGYWYGFPGFMDQVGPFDETYLHHTFSSGFTAVSDGDTIEVEAYFVPAVLVGLCHPITAPSTGTLLRASILLDVSESALPVEASSWGRVKALFHRRDQSP